MGFFEVPGFYDAETKNLIISWQDAYARDQFIIRDFLKENENILFNVLLPDITTAIGSRDFANCENLYEIHGKNVKRLFNHAFENCTNLKLIDFPKLCDVRYYALKNCNQLIQNYTNKEGLCIMNSFLYSAKQYKKEKLIIPLHIKAIETEAFCNNKIKEIVLPLKMEQVFLITSDKLDALTIPVDFSRLECDISPHTKLFYKGSEEHLYRLFKEGKISRSLESFIIINPYTFEEMQQNNFSIKDVELVLDRKLTLEEILNLGKSIKEANEYFKDEEII